jgi:osmoprotectant transport system ATP-binding protein
LASSNRVISSNNETAVVEFRDVHLRFGEAAVLNGLDLKVAAGELFVLLGRSGAGKSTVLRLVNRLLEPTAGSIRIRGEPVDVAEVTALRRRTGYVIQETGLFPHLTVRANVGVVPRLMGWEESAREARIDEMLTLTGLSDPGLGDRFPRELSGGQRQRVGVARALAADPDLLLCDEPFGALDPITRRDMQEEFRELSRRIGKTMLFVTHDVAEAISLGTRIGVLAGGTLAFDGTPDEFRTSTDPLIASLLRAELS